MAVCSKCGKEIDGNSPICMFCGTAIDDSEINQETKERMQEMEKKNANVSKTSSAKAIGALLLIIGMLLDIVSMFLIFDADFETFGAITIIGTILFFVGIALVANG